MAISQRDLAAQMISQLRLLDPSASAEVGTPERKIIDTVAQSLFDSQVDLAALQSALDIDSKYGAALDRFLSIFGFARQRATYATGFVTFKRVTPSTVDIRIPANAMVQAPADTVTPNGHPTDVPFATLFDVTLPSGDTEVFAPVRAALAGELGNVATNRITEIIASPILGISSVVNETPTSGGKNQESDEEFKVRFKNTVFRNLAGTKDQYLALAVATAFTSKANVVGPISHYREYIQVPPVADNQSYDVGGTAGSEPGGGNAGEYTTALSTIPYAKYIYSTEQPSFITNADGGPGAIYYRQDTDFRLNITDAARTRGDAARLNTAALDDDPASAAGANRPNVTFTNIYTGAEPSVQAVRPGDVLLFEFAYLSQASRSDQANGIFNTVDVYVDGGNTTLSDTVVTRPTLASAFIDNPTSKFHYENYRRVGEPEKRPVIGNVLLPLYWQPVLDVPDEILIGTTTYYKGVHYWAVEDTSTQGGTTRSRSGIEWSTKTKGRALANSVGDASTYTGPLATDSTGDPVGGQYFQVKAYTYDRNIVDLQAALEGSKQVTTDVLAHKARERFFKLDITVMYSAGVSVSDTNTQIKLAVDQFLRSQFFGSAIQLSDILSVVHSVPGVDNVRWSADTPGSPSSTRVFECDNFGRPLATVTMDRIQPGNAGTAEIQGLYITGSPLSGSSQFRLIKPDGSSATAWLNTAVSAATLGTELADDGGPSVTLDTRTTTGVIVPVRSYRITWPSNGAQLKYSVETVIVGGPYLIDNDFFLRDNELARLPSAAFTPISGTPDTVPGLIIRPRAQNTWTRAR